MKPYDLIVIGGINPDLILTGADVVPAFGHVEQLIENATLTIGSVSVITACGAAKLGLHVAFVGIVGDDLLGHFMLDTMRAQGIDCTHCVIEPKLQSGFRLILAKHDGDRATLTFAGAVAALRMGHCNPDLLTNTRHLHVGDYFLLNDLRDDLPTLFELAQSRGVTTSLDTNWDPRETWKVNTILPYCDLLLPNRQEVAKVSGTSDLRAGMAALTRVVETIAVKLGQQGGIVRRGAEIHAAPLLAVDIVDTTGADGSFNAAFLYAYLNRYPLAKAIQFACVCASLSTTAVGGTTAQPTLAEAEAALKKAGLQP